jgi:ubiquinone/menaquinone biosynthesis C-methylase UbiE
MSYHTHDEELLEPVARFFRFQECIEHIPKQKTIIMADLGCGPKLRFYDYAKKKHAKFEKYIGIDPLISTKIISNNQNGAIELIKDPLSKKIPLPSNSVDYIVACAFLEHIDNPEDIINDAIRVLKKNGKAIFTTPSYAAKVILEFLAFKLGLISSREIAEHKNYFDKNKLTSMVKNDQVTVFHKSFELGLNNLFIITKK